MKPAVCPICNGTGVVNKGFYPDQPKRTACRGCVNGVVMVPESRPIEGPVVPVKRRGIQIAPDSWRDILENERRKSGKNPYLWCATEPSSTHDIVEKLKRLAQA